jgi:hypothetical protein
MKTVTFWGGPKDGEIVRQNTQILNELFCVSNESLLLEAEEFNEIKDFPNRSQKYFKYILDYVDDSTAKYKCIGIE